MDPSRRFWILVATVGLLLALAVLTARPLLLAGGAALLGLLLALQIRFLAGLRRLDDSLRIDLASDATRVRNGDDVIVSLSVAREGNVPMSVEVDLPPSLTAESSSRVSLDQTDAEMETTISCQTHVVGTTTIDGVAVDVQDRYGLFSERLPRGQPVTLTVEARRPRNVHVGQGGERTVSMLGGHRSGYIGKGVEPAEIREYAPGDTLRDIDWKATARLGSPHVREYEAETDRRTLLVVDHRDTLDCGPAGETMLAYLREVALALTATAQDIDDPLGLYAIGDGGTTVELEPSTNDRQYERIRTKLFDLEPTTAGQSDGPRPSAATAQSPPRRKATRLDGDSAFERTLRPYLEAGAGYRTGIADDPLRRTIETRSTRFEGNVWSVVFTDDTRRAELHESVTLARRGSGHVTVFITPRVLFEPGELGDVDAAYSQYREFEAFRRDLDQLTDVTAYEVGPDDRINALLATRRRVRS